MIIVQLLGGLGNQLFQYAAGRALAEQNHDTLKLDITRYTNDQLRTYKLNHFNIIENIATQQEIHRLHPTKRHLLHKLQYKAMSYFLPPHRMPVYKETTRLVFDTEFFKIRQNVYLDGYWQNEKYFANIAHIIRREFIPKNTPSELTSHLLSMMQQTDSISLHVRRGDYISNPQTNQLYGTVGIEFYMAAINLIVESKQNPHFFIFSDDMPWVKENLPIPYPVTYVEHNGEEQDYEDLRLMSHCKNNIIANSTFSWWGAWLNQNPTKIVIAPTIWYSRESLQSNIHHLLPASWQLLAP